MGPRPVTWKRWAPLVGAAALALATAAYADGLQKFLKKAAKGQGKPAGSSSHGAAAPGGARPPAAAPGELDADPPLRTSSTPEPQGDPPPSAVQAGPSAPPGRAGERAPRGASRPPGDTRAPSGPVARRGDQRAILSLTVNLVDKGEAFVIVRGKDVLVLVSDLEGAGLHGFTGAREPVGGKEYVSVQSLTSSGITYEFDERALALRLSAPTAGLGETVIDLRPARPSNVLFGDEGSGFVNYALRLRDFRSFSAFGEAGATFRNGLLYTQVAVTPDGRAVRGLSNFSYAIPERLQRFILGDTFAATGPLGGGLFLGGVSVLRDFNLDPYFYRFPSSGLAGAVTTPSTVDVYVNGALVHRQELAPGAFQVNNLPLPVGSSTARIVVRDAFGREQVVATPFYFSTGVLKEGISDFGFHAGFRRNNLATESWDYAPAVFLGRYRLGLTDFLTPGARVEGTNGMVSGGPNATMRTPLGDVEAAASASHDRLGAGGAGSLSYTFLARALSAGALLRAFSARYANLALPATLDRPTAEANAFAGTTLGPRVSLTLRGGIAHYRDAGAWSQLGVLASVRVHETANLFVTGTRTEAASMTRPYYEAFAMLSIALPDHTTASAFYSQQDRQGSGGAEVQRPLPLGPGYGYRVREVAGPVNDFSATAQAQSAYGRYEASYQRIGQQSTSLLTASGGLVTVGGQVFATRPVQQAYGLVHVPGLRGVRGYLNNQEIGRTDGDGNLLIPELIPYYANRLSIADEDLPLDYKIEDTTRLLAPPLRGGAVARFGAQRVQIVTGRVVLAVGGAELNPSFGQMTVHAGQLGSEETASPLGKQGEFYFENLRPGKYAAEVDSSMGTCRFELEIPASESSFIDAGRLKCAGQRAPNAIPPGPIELLPGGPVSPPVDAAPLGDPPAAPSGAGAPGTEPPPAVKGPGRHKGRGRLPRRPRGDNPGDTR